ncbi:MAG TPA: glycoside hydrolase family 172 protein, partial [Planctomycetota bacterium]|nr:glycoside hydrolase family 172 protein [Planctomycetota bacterium]
MLWSNLFQDLTREKPFRAKRCSSYDRTGHNADYVVVKPGKTHVLADIRGAGCIAHLWVTHGSKDPLYRRKAVLRMWWDDEKHPSVEAPLGDFFGVGHAVQAAHSSFPFTTTRNPGGLGAMNCWFNMPYRRGARIELESEADADLVFYYYVDYQEHDAIPDDALTFHAQWRRENPCRGWKEKWHCPEFRRKEKTRAGAVTDWKNNYLILDARGRGHYVGCNLSIHNLYTGWWGEGDDAVYVDGEKWPPAIHG